MDEESEEMAESEEETEDHEEQRQASSEQTSLFIRGNPWRELHDERDWRPINSAVLGRLSISRPWYPKIPFSEMRTTE